MSHIFDALVRSKSGHAGDETKASVTNVLENAERDTMLRRETEQRSDDEQAGGLGFSQLLNVSGDGAVLASPGESPLADHAEVQRESRIEAAFSPAQAVMAADSRVVAITDPKSPAAEAFRLLGVRVRHLRRERRLNTVLITSTVAQEGKSTIASNLACTLAKGAAKSVLLLDGDLRRPALANAFGISASPGLSEYLRRKSDTTSVIYRLEHPGLWILPSGDTPDHPLELLQSPRLSALMQTIGELFEWVIIDSPPFLPLADASIWERWADGVIVVARQGTSRKRMLQKGLEAIDPQKLLCALLNVSSEGGVQDYYSYYRNEMN